MIWTPAAITQLTELWNSGLPTGEIGRRMGCTKNCVIGKAHRLQLPPLESPLPEHARPFVGQPALRRPRRRPEGKYAT